MFFIQISKKEFWIGNLFSGGIIPLAMQTIAWQIILLDKAAPIIKDGLEAQMEFAKNVLQGLTEEEKRVCITAFNKICENADEYLKKHTE